MKKVKKDATILDLWNIFEGKIEDKKNIPNLFHLSQNYPNPFNSKSVVIFSIAEQGRTTLSLYDIRGRFDHNGENVGANGAPLLWVS